MPHDWEITLGAEDDSAPGVSIGAGTTITPLRGGSHSAGLGVGLGIKGWNIGGE